MKWFYDLKVGAKLILGFTMVCLLCAAVGFIAIKNMSSMNEVSERW